MCFSPGASFTGGIIISSIGVATVIKVHKPSQIVFACIPFIFGIQQIAEGFLWLSLQYPKYAHVEKISTYFFLSMAEVVWPMLIPLSVFLMEKNEKSRRILWGLMIMGVSLSSYYVSCLLFFTVSPQIVGFHIQYDNDFPKTFSLLAFTVYLIVTVIPPFISSIKKAYLLGVLLFLSCLITTIFFTQYLISVWCFFSALISVVIYWILRDSKIKFNLDKLLLLKEQFKIYKP